MKIRILRATAIAVIIALGLTFFLIRDSKNVSAQTDDIYQNLKLLTEVLQTIQSKYVEEPDADKLIKGAIKGMVSSLDPHSSFMDAEEMKEMEIETVGKFTGIGIEITLKEDILTVVSPIEGTPADKAGIKAGDQIIKVNGQLTKQMTLMDAVKVIRGPKGSTVVLTILRKKVNKLLDIPIVRDVIPIISVKSRILGPGYGYIRVTTFQSQTVSEVKIALQKLKEENGKLSGLILDLRNNPGGLLNQAVELADIWIDKGLLVYTEGRAPAQSMKFYAKNVGTEPSYPIICLVNQGSASASEIVAGALKDHKRGLIMGIKTFGKGSVQTIIPFGDKSGLRLTTARYYTPSGVSIQAKGIEPDVQVEFIPPPQTKNNAKSFREADLKGHIENSQETEDQNETESNQSIDDETATILKKDNQLREALNLLKAWQVFSNNQ